MFGAVATYKIIIEFASFRIDPCTVTYMVNEDHLEDGVDKPCHKELKKTKIKVKTLPVPEDFVIIFI